jgi:predicted ATP-dependent serine protease
LSSFACSSTLATARQARRRRFLDALHHECVDDFDCGLSVLAVALLSSQRNTAIAHDVALFGEVGLLGEIRSVSQPDLRAREAAALGFRRVIVPQSNAAEIRADVDIVPVRRIEDVASVLF